MPPPDPTAVLAAVLDRTVRRAPRRPSGRALPDDIASSWSRCVDAGLDPAHAPALAVVGARDLAARRERRPALRRLALAELETLFQQIAGSNFLLAYADPDGVILDLYADNRFASSGSGAEILAGSLWTEAVAGTNGLGTALATGRPVAVGGPEHYFARFGDISCTAAPIRDADGDIVGVLDASSYFEHRQRHTQALVQMAAAQIENKLIADERRDDVVIALHPRAEFLATLGAGLLAFDAAGRLSACNARARSLLAGLALDRGTRFETLFAEDYGRALGRLASADEAPLHDAMGSALVGSWRNRRRGSLLAPATLSTSPRTTPPATLPSAAAGRPGLPAAAPALRPAARTPPPSFVADDPAVERALERVAAAVRLATPILIVGETGTGKELLARHAHAASGRRGAYVPVNCGALSPELFEAELFGHVDGAHAGARRDADDGLIVAADGGTLLLDEIADLPLPLQAALLRFVDDQLVRPVGGRQWRRVDVQLLASTHVDLAAEVAARRFRADLLYRLDSVRIELPPLRARRDFAAAARHLLRSIDAEASLDRDAIELLSRHDWPGNFRELRAHLLRALLGHPTGRLGADDVAAGLPAATDAFEDPLDPGAGSALRHEAAELVRREFERSGNVSATARRLGISRTTVYRYLR